MQFFYLLIFIGITKCDESNVVVPASYDHLGVPYAYQYVSQYTLSVQTSYIASVECMLSSNHYIQSGFSEIDGATNDLVTNLVSKFKNTFGNVENFLLGLQSNEDEESQAKINAVVSMTVNYYQNKNVNVEKKETKFGAVTEVEQAQSILTARRCESDYISFMNDVTTIKTMYTSNTDNTNVVDKNQWVTLVNQYYDARENIVNNTNVYASIREAFLFGSGINLCGGSTNTDQSLLEIYKADDLSKYFGKTDNDISALFSQTVRQMYTIYKNSLTVIYLKSVVHSKCDLAMRVTIWEQVNLVRANFEYMSQNIDSFIKTTKSDAESTYGIDSKEYKIIMTNLYTCVNKMLLTIVKSTEVHYKQGLNFNPDKSMIKTDFSQYKIDIIEQYYEKILLSNTDVVHYDIRVIDKEHCSYPTPEMCIPQDMYSLVINKLVFQVFLCQINYIDVQIKTTKYDKKTLDSWIYEKITIVELQNSFVFSKCVVIVNKMFIINSATYTYILLNTDKNTQSPEIQQILDQTSNDVVGTLCVNTLEITDTFNSVNIFVDKNENINTSPVEYKPKFYGNTGKSSPSTSGSQPTNSGTYSPQPSSPPIYTVPPTSGGSQPTNSGTYSPQPTSPPTYTGPPTSGGSQPTNSGTYSPQPTSPPTYTVPPTTNSGTYSPQPANGPGNNNGYNLNVEYVYVKSGTQITKIIELSKNSIQNKITLSFTNIQNTDETEYTKVVRKSLEISQQIIQYNTDYLDSITSDSIKYISEVTNPDSDDYSTALIAIFRDTQEKTSILSMTMDIPCKRTIYQITSTEYVYLNQSTVYTDFVRKFYKYFEVNYDDICNSEKDADLFLKNSIIQFNKIYEMIVTAVQQTPDNSYKTFLLSYLDKTIAVYKQTTECFKTYVVQTKQFISQQGANSILALYQEIIQRMDSMTVIYSSILIKSYQYSKSSTTVTIFESEYDVITVQTNIVSYEYTIETYTEIEISS